MTWIIDWDDLDDEVVYFVCPILQNGDSSDTFLGQPSRLKGRQVRRILTGGYAGLPVPSWQGLPPEPKKPCGEP